jgi:putative membrane protein
VSLIIRVIVNAVALWAAVLILDQFFHRGIEVGAQTTAGQVGVYLAVGAIFGVVNAVIKPIVKTVGCAFYALTLGLVALLVNAGLLWLTGAIAGVLGIPFTVEWFWPAFWGAVIIAVVSWVLSMFVGGRDD